MSSLIARCTVVYSGNVQGVGFRWQAVRALDRTPVVGYVRNCPDGTVELVMEGEPAALRDGKQRIESALGQFIRDQVETSQPATGEFARFSIRR